MARRWARSAGTAFIVYVGFLAGCAAPEPLAAPSSETLQAALDRILFDPESTCEELQAEFGAWNLPLVNDPSELGLMYEDVRVVTDDGETLRVWLLPADAARGLVVLSIGNSGELPCYLFTAQIAIGAGFSVAMVEPRGFGESTGVPSVEHLADDLEVAAEWARSATGEPAVALMGVSLGTVASAAVAARRPDLVSAVVLDSPLVLAAQFERLEPVFGANTTQVLGLLDPEWEVDVQVARSTQPLLVLSGSSDVLTPAIDAQRVYDASISAERAIVFFPNAGHARGQFLYTAWYTDILAEFLEKTRPQR